MARGRLMAEAGEGTMLAVLGATATQVRRLAAAHGVAVANNPLFCREEVADHAMTLVLACARRLMFCTNL